MVLEGFEYEDVPEEAQEHLTDIIGKFNEAMASPVVGLVGDLHGIQHLIPVQLHASVVVHAMMLAAARVAYSYLKMSNQADGMLDDTHVDGNTMEHEVLFCVGTIIDAVTKQAEGNLNAAKARRDATRN